MPKACSLRLNGGELMGQLAIPASPG